MHISRFDGSVTFEGGLIQRTMDKAAFLASTLGTRSRRTSINEDYEAFDLVPEPGTMATVAFRGDRMLNVSITFDLPDDAPETRSMQHELERKKVHDEYLRRELGEPPYRYMWGTVASDFYHQHCGSEITVTYSLGDDED